MAETGSSGTSTSSVDTTGEPATSAVDTSAATSVDTTAGPADSSGSTSEAASSSSGAGESTSTTDASTGSGSSDGSTSTGPVDVCGDGSITGTEVCEPGDLGGEDCLSQNFDAGELACAADCQGFDTSGCLMFSCGNGVLEGREVCDGDQLAGQDCIALGHDAGTLACDDGCAAFDESGCIDFVCGNDILEGDEVCDTNQTSGTACVDLGYDDGTVGCLPDCTGYDDTACYFYECGNDILEGDEICDTNQLSGEDCFSQGFDGGSLACAADCTGYDTAACTVCGDNVLDAGEACDTAQLNGQSCVTQGGAGGVLGCSASCSFDTFSCYPAVAETEPNDDGATAVATNDFSSAAANGPFSDDVTISATISPAGDDDVFAVTNPLGVPQLLTVETFGPAGLGTCTAIDTVVNIRDAAGVSLTSDDDAGIGSCSRIANFSLAPGQTVYVHVIEYNDDGAISRYFTQITLVTAGCGNLVLETGEQCDDGNLGIGDGCNATCGIEGGLAEVEPNATTAQADAAPISISSASPSTAIVGAIGPVADIDTYRINVAADGVLRLETFTGLHDCIGGMTTTLRLRNSLGTQLVQSTTEGIASCSAIVYPVAAGTYYAEVGETGNNAAIAQYVLEAEFYANGGTEVEPNDTIDVATVQANESYVFGDHQLGADSDIYALTIPQGGSLRAEVVEGALATENCEGQDIDSRLTLYNPGGVQLYEDDDAGRGYCSLIDGTGGAPTAFAAHNLPAGTYYLQVRSSTLASPTGAQFDYRLAVTVRAP